VAPLTDATKAVQDQLSAVLAQATPQVDGVLAQAGVTLSLVEPHDEQVESGAATRITSGLSLTMSYKGREQQALVDLVNSIPAELKPNVGPVPNPVTFLAENHITGLALAPASVSSLATPPFPALDIPIAELPATASFDPGSSSLGGSAFSTPAAPLPAGPEATVDDLSSEPAAHGFEGAVPAILVALALLASPLFGMGSTRLADNVLAPAAAPCPLGLDQPTARST
jgi:hypothetical protein